MKQIAIIGANGHIGSAIFAELKKNTKVTVCPVTRQNYFYWKKKTFDIIINAAMPSARFWANTHPKEDFIETVKKTADIVYGWRYKKIIQISTVSARMERDSIYGRHKAAAEMICSSGENLTLRLTAVYSDNLQKGALIDILNGKKVYVDKKSRYAFASLSFISQWIAKNLEKKGLIELGAKNTVSLEEIVNHFKLSIQFEGRLDIQEVQEPLSDFPDARDVLYYMEKRLHLLEKPLKK